MQLGQKASNGTQRARLAKLLLVGVVKGSCAVELQGEGFDVNTQNPARDAANVGGRGDGGSRNVVLGFDFFDSKGLAVEAAHAGCHDALDHMEGVAVEDGVAVDAGSGCVLEPQPAVDDGSQIWIDTARAVLVELGEREIEHGGVAGADEMGAVALD